MKFKETEIKAARIVRILSIPPVTVTIMMITLYFFINGIYSRVSDAIMIAVCLAVIPVSAYPICAAIPALRVRGRAFQRKSAFVSSAVGYIIGMAYALISHSNKYVLFVFCSYFVSLIVLTVFNKLIKIRASGHACGISGPITLLSIAVSPLCAVFGLLIYSIIFRASVVTGRHTVKEFIFGTLTGCLSVAASSIILFIL